uniref:DIRP domain-containing protein n=1 Tax=Anopheles merus TaxID=30066 RepID=A0A182V7N3_ANOME
MMCQRFVSHIDAAAFALKGHYEFDSIFRQEKESLYPTLVNSSITNVERKLISNNVRKRVLIGRFSPAFISKKRVELEKRRELLRFLMANPMIEYTDGVNQWTVPDPIQIGSKGAAGDGGSGAAGGGGGGGCAVATDRPVPFGHRLPALLSLLAPTPLLLAEGGRAPTTKAGRGLCGMVQLLHRLLDGLLELRVQFTAPTTTKKKTVLLRPVMHLETLGQALQCADLDPFRIGAAGTEPPHPDVLRVYTGWCRRVRIGRWHR